MKPHQMIRRTVAVVIGIILLSPLTCLGGWPDLTASELKSLLDDGQNMLLINPLSDIEFNESHIPGSVSIPLHTIMQTKALPGDKNTLIVTYCLSPK